MLEEKNVLFHRVKLSVFVSAMMQMKQANPIQIEINFLAIVAHGMKQLVKTRNKKRGTKGD